MNRLNLVQMKRCPTCGHLIPKGYDQCPYCSNTEIKLPNTDASEPPHKREPMSPRTKKRLRNGFIIGGSIAMLLIAGFAILSNYYNARIMKQSILVPLTQSQLEAKRKSCPQLMENVELFEEIRDKVIGTPDKATYENITYQQMIDYLDFLSDEKTQLQEKATEAYQEYSNPYEEKFRVEADKWTDFYNKHDPAAYLKLTFHTRYHSEYWYVSYLYYPAFWTDIEYPRGSIKNCEVVYGLWSEEDQQWYKGTTFTASLEQLKDFKESKEYHFTNIVSYSPDIYNSYSIKYEIKSVTLSDGTLIKDSDRNEIPEEMLRYIEDQIPVNKTLAIRALVEKDFMEQEAYVDSYLDKAYKEKDELCYELLLKVGKLSKPNTENENENE